jgi:hypothetical protein
MLAPFPIVHDPPSLLGDVRLLLSSRPGLVDYPERLGALLGADARDVRGVLEVLEALDAEVLA